VRVLKPSGSMFINLGDKYAGGGTLAPNIPPKAGPGDHLRRYGKVQPHGTTKSLLGLPWRYAIACTDQLGLILPAEIIWAKPNGLPESVTDRVRRAHEQVFHLVRQPRYYSAVDEIRQPYAAPGRVPGKNAMKSRTASGALLGVGCDVRGELGHENPLGALPGS